MMMIAYMLERQRQEKEALIAARTKLRDAMAARLGKMTAIHDASTTSQDQIRAQRPTTTVRARPTV